MTNPLLFSSSNIRFDLIKAEHIVPAVRQAIKEEVAKQAAIEAIPAGQHTLENTLLAIDRLGMQLHEIWTVVTELKFLVGSAEIKAASDEVETEVEEFESKIFLSPKLYNALADFAKCSDLSKLTPGQTRTLEKLVKTFELNGVSLPNHQRGRLTEIDSQLAVKASQFDSNLKAASMAFELVLDTPPIGVPADAISRAKENAEKSGYEGKYKFGADAGSFDAIMKFAVDRHLRQRMHQGFHSRCLTGELDNIKVAEDELRLRQEKAKILKEAGIAGINSFADYNVALRVAKNSENIKIFLNDLEKCVRPVFEAECRELTEFAREYEKDPSFTLNAWDFMFYSERLREAQCGFKEDEIKPYIERDRFINAALGLAERLYGLSFKANPKLPAWHPDVQGFDILSESGAKFGAFYIDLYSRTGEKRDGAWQDTLIRRHPGIAGHDLWLGLLTCNFPRPAKGEPSLLAPREAETFLHELGHLLQQLAVHSSEVTLAEPPWDAIEIPSQLNENFFWEREFFLGFATHCHTNQPCPAELFEKLHRARNFQKGIQFMTQVGYSLLDIIAHTDEHVLENGGLRAKGHQIMSKCSPVALPEYAIMYNRFSHIFSGEYAAGYYSYAWALAMACDCFCHIRDKGVFDSKTARKYWDLILATGDTRDCLGAVNEFLGRPTNAPIRAQSIAEFYNL